MLEEIRTQLDARGVVKVKWLQDTDIDPQEIAARTHSVLIDARGRTIVLAKRKRV
ncbi:MAG: YhbY family RNA-binding protein [Methanomicrobiales archaeon]|nr:YhbY family RNA-binding protein [Methanomicrobiales archaeon]